MKIKLSRLKKIIRETIEEVATPGDTRYGMSGDARGGVRGGVNSRGVTFPGHPASYPTASSTAPSNQQGLSSPGSSYVPNQQGLSSPGGSYVQGVGWVPGPAANNAADVTDEKIDATATGVQEDEFFLVLDSQVTRGNEGNIKHVPSGNVFTAQGSKFAGGNILGDLNMAFQKSGGKRANERAKEVIGILMDNDLLAQQDINPELISEIGVRGRDSGKIYPIEEYFMDFNGGFIKECRRIMKKVLR